MGNISQKYELQSQANISEQNKKARSGVATQVCLSG